MPMPDGTPQGMPNTHDCPTAYELLEADNRRLREALENLGTTDDPEAWDTDTCAGCLNWCDGISGEWENGQQISPDLPAGCSEVDDRRDCPGKEFLVVLQQARAALQPGGDAP